MLKRTRNLVVACSDEELAMLHQLADDRDEPISRVVRRWIKDTYITTYGMKKPRPAKLKHGT